MSELRTDFKDEILQEGETHRVYDIKRKGTDEIVESDIYLEKAYTPLQEGDNFGAKEVNEIHGRLNGLAPQNLLINGDFNIWQRGTTFNDIANQYTADMWRIENAASSVTLVERSTDVPSNADCNYSIHLKDTWSNANFYLIQKGMNFKGNFVLSFWYKSNKNFPTYYIDGSGMHLLGVNEPSSEWKYVSYKFSSNNLSTLNIIQGAFNGDFYIASVRLYRGEIDYPHIAEDDAIALMRCQEYERFYETLLITISYDYNEQKFQAVANFPKMKDIPTFTHGKVEMWANTGSMMQIGIESKEALIDRIRITTRTTPYARKSGTCIIFLHDVNLTCEPL